MLGTKGRKIRFSGFFFTPLLWVLFRCKFVCVCVFEDWLIRCDSRLPMVWPGVESGVTDPSGDGWNCCWTLVRIILAK